MKRRHISYGKKDDEDGVYSGGRNKKLIDAKRRRLLLKNQRKTNAQLVENIIAKYANFAKEDTSKFDSFTQFPLSSSTMKGLEENLFVKPTEIQRDSLQYSLNGVDVVGAAKTGSGKTLALLIPLLECLWRHRWSRNTDGLGALVICPTRELAYQTFNVLNKIGKYHNFSAALLIGGTDIEFEKSRMASVNIVIATPGRLLQHMDENVNFSCEQLQMLVVDEADRILDLGFQKQMNAIVANLPETRQTLLFSATQTKNVDDLARLALKDPMYISVHENAPQATPEQLQQNYLICADEDKINMLWSYLVSHRRKKTLIFVSCCKQARFLTEAFCHLRPGTSLMGLWGTMKQTKRLEIFHKFDSKMNSAAMIATDVASRGLDFAHVDCVLQLDCPSTADDYIHRVGRTARLDAKGEGILVLTPSQEQPMLTRLHAKNIPLSKISVDNRQMLDIRKKLRSTIAQFQHLKEFAQRSFVAYIRSVYLMANKDVFDVHSIDCKALAESYGLAVVPRVRFLARVAARESLKNETPSQKSAKKEKSAKELLKMMIASAKHRKQDIIAGSDDEMMDDDMSGGNDHANEEVDFELRQEMLGEEEGYDVGIEESLKANNSDVLNGDDDLLKVVHKDVFHVMGDQDQHDESEEDLEMPKKRGNKSAVLKRSVLVKKTLKKGIKLNVKKIYDENGEEIIVQQPQPQSSSKLSNDELDEHFDLETAKREMMEADRVDKASYRERMKQLRKEKKAKLKKKLEERKRQRAEGQNGGAVLDLGDGEGSAGDDLSWLPDPDKPKEYDAEWNEIKDGPEVDEDGKGKGKKVKRKEINRQKVKKSKVAAKSTLTDDEAKALALLESVSIA